MVTTAKRVVHDIDVGAIEQAIRAAEQRTSGEIRVAIGHPWFQRQARAAAERTFARLGMAKTRDRNGVLIFVAPRWRQLAVVGDVGVHAKMPADFWSTIVDRMIVDFRRGDRTAGLLAAIALLADALAAAFPPRPADVNELSDSVSLDGR
jgi:uncharacterized membrane protein